MDISENELWTLSYYRESELAGALIMGRLARETDDDDLRVHLTEHCAEEAQHAWLWTQTILKVGGTPKHVSETYQTRYYAAVGHPTTLLEILALTQVFERRVMRHFRAHLRTPGTHPAVVETLERMIAEEVGHIGWVKARLDRTAREKGAHIVADVMRRYTEVDRRVYAELMQYRDRAAELFGGGRVVALPEDEPLSRQVRRIVARSLNLPEGDVTATASLRDLGVNSLDLVVLVMSIEESFRIEFEPADLERLHTFADLVQRVGELTRRTRAA
jgi:acyl carrier protein